MTYHLGTSEAEQARLFEQVKYYGDTEGIAFRPSDHICELGCGPLSNLWIPQQLMDGRYVGVDISAQQIAKARAQAKQADLSCAEFIEGNADQTGLPPSAFDVVIVRCLLIHLRHPLSVVKEMVRLLKPGGRLILIEPHDPTYFVTPNKENLMRAQKARVTLGYENGRGSPDAALNLFTDLTLSGAINIRVRPHVITADSHERERCAWFLRNLVRMAEPISESAIEQKLLTVEEWKRAQEEAESVEPGTFLYQSMWIAEASR